MRQGCLLSPLLFDIYIDYSCHRSSRGSGGWDRDRGRSRFADDQAIIARSQGGLQAVMNRLNTVDLNGKETVVEIRIGGREREQEKEFR